MLRVSFLVEILLGRIRQLYLEWAAEAKGHRGRLDLSPEFVVEDFLRCLGLEAFLEQVIAPASAGQIGGEDGLER